MYAIRSYYEYGVDVTVHAVNQAVMYEKKDLAVETLRNGIERLLKNANISVIKGKASDVREGRFTVTTTEEVKEIKAEHILLATGSRPYRIPIEGSQDVITSYSIHYTKLYEPIFRNGYSRMRKKRMMTSLPLGILIPEKDQIIYPMTSSAYSVKRKADWRLRKGKKSPFGRSKQHKQSL